MNAVKVHLSEILGRHRISQRQLAERAQLRPATVGALYHEQVKGVEFATLAAIVHALTEMTGERYTAADLIEVVGAPTEDAQTRVARERALALLIRPEKPGKPEGSAHPVKIEGPSTEELLKAHRGPEP